MAEKSKEELAAIQAISPAGMGDRSDKGKSASGVASESPDDEVLNIQPTDIEDKYVEGEGEEPASNLRETHPNRNRDGKPQLDKPSYGGGH
ncbi:hypothetical protein GCM10028803_47620 [Larkinella knui]|uniref:Uncharacterized protein n=1 Tax=Larkinella knui TaxID=2025310 RepID=A0A3P1CQV4_9BACT|nr:hypothetical protein [Larkinella knui]RRB15344.1 hypothetical protein EHT87_12470 [Larkinella knui]